MGGVATGWVALWALVCGLWSGLAWTLGFHHQKKVGFGEARGILSLVFFISFNLYLLTSLTLYSYSSFSFYSILTYSLPLPPIQITSLIHSSTINNHTPYHFNFLFIILSLFIITHLNFFISLS